MGLSPYGAICPNAVGPSGTVTPLAVEWIGESGGGRAAGCPKRSPGPTEGPYRRSLQKTLHYGEVDPPAEFAGDLALHPHEIEPSRSVQPNRGLMTSHDPGKARMETRITSQVQDLVEKDAPQPSILVIPMHVHRVLHARGVRGLRLPRGDRGEAEDSFRAGAGRIVVHRHDCAEDAGVVSDPFHLYFERPRNQIHRDGRLGDLEVVDRTERFSIGQGHSAGSNRHGPDDKGPRADRRLLKYGPPFLGTENALLAQSVEHFHGKEKVVGSIPTEGSTRPPRYARTGWIGADFGPTSRTRPGLTLGLSSVVDEAESLRCDERK